MRPVGGQTGRGKRKVGLGTVKQEREGKGAKPIDKTEKKN